MHFVFLALGYHPDLVGGAYRYAADVAVRLAARGHQVEVIVPNPENRFPGREVRDGVVLLRYPDEKGGAWSSWRKENQAARALLERQATPDALACFHQGFFQPCLKGLEPRSLALFHGPWGLEFLYARRTVPRGWLGRAKDRLIAFRLAQVERKLLQNVRRVLVMSRYVSSRLKEWHGSSLPPVEVIYGGVDTVRFAPPADRARLRQHLGLSADAFLLTTVRRLDPRMGLLTLVEGFAAVAADFPKALLWLAGTGPQREALEAQVRALGLEGRVRLLGFVPEPDLPGLLGASDCTLMPSLDLEGFGLATVEALACGTPVLGSKAGATPEILTTFGSHLLFEPGSATSLAGCLRSVLATPETLPAREACREHVLREFTWKRPVAALERAWTEIVG
jgi:glycosyltransferase involved in cell wall biosynthesis